MGSRPPVVLFGYESSTFTLKVRLALRLKQIKYSFITVPSMMPRPVLRDLFNLTYRKIPVLAIGRALYCDSSIICEALEQRFPASDGYQSLYPATQDGSSYRPLIRLLASHWADRALFRTTTGLIPASVWRTSFGKDRAQLIGHPLDADKLEKKLPENLLRLDTNLSMLETLFDSDRDWLLSTSTPSMADLSVWYQLKWGTDIAKGLYIDNLSGGGTPDTSDIGASEVLNAERYPAVSAWYDRFEQYINSLPPVESKDPDLQSVIRELKAWPSEDQSLLPTPQDSKADLVAKCGLHIGTKVAVAPDDTGRDDPTIGTLTALSPEEIVIKPVELNYPPKIDVDIHFPRIGFVVRPVPQTRS